MPLTPGDRQLHSWLQLGFTCLQGPPALVDFLAALLAAMETRASFQILLSPFPKEGFKRPPTVASVDSPLL